MTLYETLEVSEGASKETIHAAYKSLAKRFHPDVASTPAASNRMALITEAYSILSDDEKRAKYDSDLNKFRANPHFGQTDNTMPNGGTRPGSTADKQEREFRTPPRSNGIAGMPVEDLAMGLLEQYLLPSLPAHVSAAYPMARGDIRSLISMGLERLVQ